MVGEPGRAIDHRNCLHPQHRWAVRLQPSHKRHWHQEIVIRPCNHLGSDKLSVGENGKLHILVVMADQGSGGRDVGDIVRGSLPSRNPHLAYQASSDGVALGDSHAPLSGSGQLPSLVDPGCSTLIDFSCRMNTLRYALLHGRAPAWPWPWVPDAPSARAIDSDRAHRECPILCVRGVGLQVVRESVGVSHG